MQTLKEIINKLNGVDPYDMLQSSPLEDFASLKKNYRMLALKYHPDRNKQESAKEKFIQINLAYEFLEQQSNRQIYQNHLKALREQKQRQSKMTDDRKKMLEQLKRREEEYHQRKKDMDQELKRKKEFFLKKMKEQEERQKLREQILSQMKPNQYYEQLTSIKVEWQKGLSFTKFLLQKAFSQQGKITNINLQPKHRQAIITFSSIDVCTKCVKEFQHAQIKVDYMVQRIKRQRLLKAIKMQKMSGRDVDFSLTTENLARLKQIINRGSGFYFDQTARVRDE